MNTLRSELAKIVIFSNILHSMRSSNFLGRVGAMTISRILVSASALMVLLILPRMLDQEVLAHYRKLWLLFAATGPVIISAAVATAYYRGGLGKDHTGAALRGLLRMLIPGALVISGISWMAAPFLADYFWVPELADAYRLFAVYGFFAICGGLAEPLFVLTHHKRWLPVCTGIFVTLDIVAVLIPFYSGASLETVVLYMVAAQAVRLPVLMFLFRKWVPEVPRSTDVAPASIWKYAVSMGLLAMAGVGAVEIDRMIVGRLLDDVSFLMYDYGSRKLPFITIFTASISSALVAGYSAAVQRGEMEGIISQIKQGSSLAVRVMLPLIVVLAAGAPVLMALLFGEDFRPAAPVFALFMVALTSNLFFPHAVVLASGRAWINVMGSVAELLVNVVLSLLLIGKYGIAGVAFAAAVAHWVYTLSMAAYCRYSYGVAFRSFLPSGIPGWFWVAVAGLAGAASFVHQFHFSVFLGVCVLAGLTAFSGFSVQREWTEEK